MTATAIKKPRIAIGEKVTEFQTQLEKTLQTIDIDDNTQFLQATTYPLYYWGVKEITNSTFSQGE
jgi:hypothetical protein